MAELKETTTAEVQRRLHEAFACDPESSLGGAMLRSMADPAIARDAKKRFRPHPLLLTLAAILLLALVAFIYFSFSR